LQLSELPLSLVIRYLIPCLIVFNLGAQQTSLDQAGPTVVAVGEAEIELVKIIFAPLSTKGELSSEQRKQGEQLNALFANDFSFYRQKFSVIKPAGDLAQIVDGAPPYDQLTRRGIANWCRLTISAGSGSSIRYRLEMFSVEKQLMIFNEAGRINQKGWRAEGHQLSDSLYQALTGQSSIFTSSIFFVSDYGSTRKNPFKELYRMDFDGQGVKRLTNHRGTVISPAVSPDGNKLLYSLIRNYKKGRGAKRFRRNINLYMLDLTTGVRKLISSRPGLNSGAIFSHDGESIYLTMSFVGNAEIYRLKLSNRKLTRVTRNYAHDVDPSTSRVGEGVMAFLSNRPGRAMIYTLNPKGVEKSVKRISYVGKFNATPRISPDGMEIAFSSWVDNRFDIYRINVDGTSLSRLTKDFGSNEDPSYSPDGEFITFSSQRVLSSTRAVQNLYIMDRNGDILGSITKNLGNCITPRWSN
jgi:TolB protein